MTVSSDDDRPPIDRRAHRILADSSSATHYTCRCGQRFAIEPDGWTRWLEHLPPAKPAPEPVRSYPELERLPLSSFDRALAVLRERGMPDLVDSLGCALEMFRAAGFEVPELEPQPDQQES